DLHLSRLASKTEPAAVGANRIAAITAEKYADVQLVLLALQVLEEAAHSPELLVTIHDEALLFCGQIMPRQIIRHAGSTRVAPHLGSVGSIFRLGPWIDRTFGQRERLIRYY